MIRPAVIRERLGLTRSELARALGVHERTVTRWEDGGIEPNGLVAEVMRGIDNALEEGADPHRVARLVGLGIGSLLCYSLLNQVPHDAPRR